MRWRLRWTTWTVTTLAVVACSGGEPPREAAADTTSTPPPPADAVLGASWSHDGSRLAVTWKRGRRARIFGLFGPAKDTILPTPSRGLPVTSAEGSDASWAPDGLWMAFATTRGGNSEIYRARPDGTGPENLTRNPADDGEPAYAPNGRRIAFTSDRDGHGTRLYLMNADGTDPHAVDPAGVPSDADQLHPAWSPDGRVLAFTARRGAVVSIWVDTLSGGGSGKVASGDAPAWSADGAYLFFSRNDSIFRTSLRGPRGGDATLVVADGRAPSPSPRGHWLAFVRGTADQAALYLLDLGTKAVTRITS